MAHACCSQVSKIPIICICNDAWSQKLRSLKNHCLELKFARPTKQMIRGRMMKIAQQEGLEVCPHFSWRVPRARLLMPLSR